MAKRKHEEHENHERWLVSYADFITLLFAFFVVMYSISSVNVGKYRTVSESIKAALNPMANLSGANQVFSVGDGKVVQRGRSPTDAKEVTAQRIRQKIQVFKDQQVKDLAAFISVTPKINGDIVITIPDRLLFNSGEATIRAEALPFLKGLGGIILEMDRHARVEGHTDNVPIRTAQFPSNWELSSARSVIVVRVLSELYGVPADHLAAVGHADTRPITKNLDAEQRAKNRRVEVVILEQAPPAPVLLSGDGLTEAEHTPDEAAQAPIQLDPVFEDKGPLPMPWNG